MLSASMRRVPDGGVVAGSDAIVGVGMAHAEEAAAAPSKMRHLPPAEKIDSGVVAAIAARTQSQSSTVVEAERGFASGELALPTELPPDVDAHVDDTATYYAVAPAFTADTTLNDTEVHSAVSSSTSWTETEDLDGVAVTVTYDQTRTTWLEADGGIRVEYVYLTTWDNPEGITETLTQTGAYDEDTTTNSAGETTRTRVQTDAFVMTWEADRTETLEDGGTLDFDGSFLQFTGSQELETRETTDAAGGDLETVVLWSSGRDQYGRVRSRYDSGTGTVLITQHSIGDRIDEGGTLVPESVVTASYSATIDHTLPPDEGTTVAFNQSSHIASRSNSWGRVHETSTETVTDDELGVVTYETELLVQSLDGDGSLPASSLPVEEQRLGWSRSTATTEVSYRYRGDRDDPAILTRRTGFRSDSQSHTESRLTSTATTADYAAPPTTPAGSTSAADHAAIGGAGMRLERTTAETERVTTIVDARTYDYFRTTGRGNATLAGYDDDGDPAKFARQRVTWDVGSTVDYFLADHTAPHLAVVDAATTVERSQGHSRQAAIARIEIAAEHLAFETPGVTVVDDFGYEYATGSTDMESHAVGDLFGDHPGFEGTSVEVWDIDEAERNDWRGQTRTDTNRILVDDGTGTGGQIPETTVTTTSRWWEGLPVAEDPALDSRGLGSGVATSTSTYTHTAVPDNSFVDPDTGETIERGWRIDSSETSTSDTTWEDRGFTTETLVSRLQPGDADGDGTVGPDEQGVSLDYLFVVNAAVGSISGDITASGGLTGYRETARVGHDRQDDETLYLETPGEEPSDPLVITRYRRLASDKVVQPAPGLHTYLFEDGFAVDAAQPTSVVTASHVGLDPDLPVEDLNALADQFASEVTAQSYSYEEFAEDRTFSVDETDTQTELLDFGDDEGTRQVDGTSTETLLITNGAESTVLRDRTEVSIAADGTATVVSDPYESTTLSYDYATTELGERAEVETNLGGGVRFGYLTAANAVLDATLMQIDERTASALALGEGRTLGGGEDDPPLVTRHFRSIDASTGGSYALEVVDRTANGETLVTVAVPVTVVADDGAETVAFDTTTTGRRIRSVHELDRVDAHTSTEQTEFSAVQLLPDDPDGSDDAPDNHYTDAAPNGSGLNHTRRLAIDPAEFGGPEYAESHLYQATTETGQAIALPEGTAGRIPDGYALGLAPTDPDDPATAPVGGSETFTIVQTAFGGSGPRPSDPDAVAPFDERITTTHVEIEASNLATSGGTASQSGQTYRGGSGDAFGDSGGALHASVYRLDTDLAVRDGLADESSRYLYDLDSRYERSSDFGTYALHDPDPPKNVSFSGTPHTLGGNSFAESVRLRAEAAATRSERIETDDAGEQTVVADQTDDRAQLSHYASQVGHGVSSAHLPGVEEYSLSDTSTLNRVEFVADIAGERFYERHEVRGTSHSERMSSPVGDHAVKRRVFDTNFDDPDGPPLEFELSDQITNREVSYSTLEEDHIVGDVRFTFSRKTGLLESQSKRGDLFSYDAYQAAASDTPPQDINHLYRVRKLPVDVSVTLEQAEAAIQVLTAGGWEEVLTETTLREAGSITADLGTYTERDLDSETYDRSNFVGASWSAGDDVIGYQIDTGVLSGWAHDVSQGSPVDPKPEFGSYAFRTGSSAFFGDGGFVQDDADNPDGDSPTLRSRQVLGAGYAAASDAAARLDARTAEPPPDEPLEGDVVPRWALDFERPQSGNSPLAKEDWDDEVSVDNPDFTWRPWWWDRALEFEYDRENFRDEQVLTGRFGDSVVETHGRWLITNGWAGYYDQEPYDADPEDGLAPPSFSFPTDYDDVTKADLVANRLAYGGNDPEPFTLPASISGGSGGSGSSGGNSAFAASGTGFGSVSGGGTDRSAAAPSGDLSALPPGVVAYARTGPGWTDTPQPPAGQRPDPTADPSGGDPLDAIAAAIAAGDDRFGGQAAGASGIQPTGGSPQQPTGGPSQIDPNGILPGGFGSGLGVAGTVGGFGTAGTATGNGQGEPPAGAFEAILKSLCDCICSASGVIPGEPVPDEQVEHLNIGLSVELQGFGMYVDGRYVMRALENDGRTIAVPHDDVTSADPDENSASEWDAWFAEQAASGSGIELPHSEMADGSGIVRPPADNSGRRAITDQMNRIAELRKEKWPGGTGNAARHRRSRQMEARLEQLLRENHGFTQAELDAYADEVATDPFWQRWETRTRGAGWMLATGLAYGGVVWISGAVGVFIPPAGAAIYYGSAPFLYDHFRSAAYQTYHGVEYETIGGYSIRRYFGGSSFGGAASAFYDYGLLAPGLLPGAGPTLGRTVLSDSVYARIFYTPFERGSKLIPAGRGTTDELGNITYSTQGAPEEILGVLYHERVHSGLSPKLRFLQQLRSRLAVEGYRRSDALKYIEEALAETISLARIEGLSLSAVRKGLAFPLRHADAYNLLPSGIVTELAMTAMGSISLLGLTYAASYTYLFCDSIDPAAPTHD